MPDLKRTGFTLVEMLVTAMIMGIMLTLAIPSYQKHTARGLQQEAKVSLTAIFTMERAYFTEQGTYTACIKQIGFDPTSSQSLRHYAIGFPAYDPGLGSNFCGISGTSDCLTWAYDASGNSTDACTSPDDISFPQTTAATSSFSLLTAPVGIPPSKFTFIAGASGNVNTAGAQDDWVIDQNKSLLNGVGGI